jgi:hypothetical protein
MTRPMMATTAHRLSSLRLRFSRVNSIVCPLFVVAAQ